MMFPIAVPAPQTVDRQNSLPIAETGAVDVSAEQEQAMREAAMKFEASFIAQMLTHSGFADCADQQWRQRC